MRFSAVIFILLLSIIPVYAELDINHRADKAVILPGEDAVFYVTVRNTGASDQVSLTYSDDYWRAKIEPNDLILPINSYETVKVTLSPLNTAQPGNHKFKILFFSRVTSQVIDEYVLDLTLVDSKNAISVDVLADELDPLALNQILQIKFRNNYNVPFDNIHVTIESELFSTQRDLDFKPEEIKIEDFAVLLPALKEGEYAIDITLSLNNKELATTRRTVDIAKIRETTKTTNVVEGLFTKVREVSIVNEGNAFVKETYSETLTWMQDIFTSTEPEPTQVVKEGSTRTLIWDVGLEPGASSSIFVKTGYRGFIIFIIVLLIVIGFLYYWFGREISIRKKVITLKTEKEGIASIKVLLTIKNRGTRDIDGLRVMDRLPHMIHPIHEEFGLRKPASIKKSGDGVALIWHVDRVYTHSEVVISYLVKAQLHIIGSLKLPAAHVHYRNAQNKVITVTSNTLTLTPLPEQ